MRFSSVLHDLETVPKEGPYNRILPERYEGFLCPKIGPSPFRVIDDPVLIRKKNQMRNALREEYTKKILNPYRNAAGVGGVATDAMFVRYNAMLRTQHLYFRPGPKSTFCGLSLIFGVPLTIGLISESYRRPREIKYRTGQIAYKDRECKLIN